MVFGITKKERRVPDLSRYDYYYKAKQDYNKSSQLSADAAFAASSAPRSLVNASPSQISRTASLVANSPAGARRASQSSVHNQHYVPRTPNKTRIPSNYYRSYSLRSQGSVDTVGMTRLGSLTSSRGVAISSPSTKRNTVNGGNTNDSRANSITVQTTEIKDAAGRTQSITKKTIKRVNGYEYVETTTTTTTTSTKPAIASQMHFDEFSDNFLQDDGIEGIQEEDENESNEGENMARNTKPWADPNYQKSNGHDYRALTTPMSHNNSNNIQNTSPPPQISSMDNISSDGVSSSSKFTDARDDNLNSPPQAKHNGRFASRRPKTQNKKRMVRLKETPNQNHENRESPMQEPLSEEMMYAKALEVARKKVYNLDNASENETIKGRASGNKYASRMSQRMSLRKDSRVSAPSDSPKPVNSFPIRSRSKPTPTADTSLKASPTYMSDEAMYAKAVEIAQKKYNESHALTSTVSASANSRKAFLHTDNATFEEPMKSNLDVSSPVTGGAQRQRTYSSSAESGVFKDHQSIESPKSKFKLQNMFDKVVQFSQANSGYQPTKKERLAYEQEQQELQRQMALEAEIAEPALPKITEEPLAGPVETETRDARQRRPSSFGGTSTTLPVQDTLPVEDQTNIGSLEEPSASLPSEHGVMGLVYNGSNSSFCRKKSTASNHTSLKESLRPMAVQPQDVSGDATMAQEHLTQQTDIETVPTGSVNTTGGGSVVTKTKSKKKTKKNFFSKLFKR